jgi:hypothetical protein
MFFEEIRIRTQTSTASPLYVIFCAFRAKKDENTSDIYNYVSELLYCLDFVYLIQFLRSISLILVIHRIGFF